jgi:hypothetical protein
MTSKILRFSSRLSLELTASPITVILDGEFAAQTDQGFERIGNPLAWGKSPGCHPRVFR